MDDWFIRPAQSTGLRWLLFFTDGRVVLALVVLAALAVALYRRGGGWR